VEPATHVTAAEAANATRKSGTTSRRHSDHHGCGNRKNSSVSLSFHDRLLFVCSLTGQMCLAGDKVN
jgi:hypothetical protein